MEAYGALGSFLFAPDIISSMNNTLKIATWNVLWPDLGFNKRLPEIAANLSDADIICLQEVREYSESHAGEEISKKLDIPVVSSVHYATSDNVKYELGIKEYLVILSRYPAIENGVLDTKTGDYGLVAFALLDTPYRPTLVFSVHLEWGGEKEFQRLEQIKEINIFSTSYLKKIKEKYGLSPIVILCGDFNTEPGSQSVMYLSGKQASSANNQAYWIDAWRFANPGLEGYTSAPSENNLAHKIGEAHVYNPSMLPSRRIDYIFVKGWAYGGPGHPMKANLIGSRSLLGETLGSDHYGVLVEIWNPPAP